MMVGIIYIPTVTIAKINGELKSYKIYVQGVTLINIATIPSNTGI